MLEIIVIGRNLEAGGRQREYRPLPGIGKEPKGGGRLEVLRATFVLKDWPYCNRFKIEAVKRRIRKLRIRHVFPDG